MAFTKAPNVAQYQGADWSNLKKRVPNCTPAGAQRIAMRDPSITFFFYCRDPINLRAKGSFNRGERNRAIVKAALRHGYSQAAIATHLGLHHSSVSKVIKQKVSHDSRFKT